MVWTRYVLTFCFPKLDLLDPCRRRLLTVTLQLKAVIWGMSGSWTMSTSGLLRCFTCPMLQTYFTLNFLDNSYVTPAARGSFCGAHGWL